jgi:hypothetical protein
MASGLSRSTLCRKGSGGGEARAGSESTYSDAFTDKSPEPLAHNEGIGSPVKSSAPDCVEIDLGCLSRALNREADFTSESSPYLVHA